MKFDELAKVNVNQHVEKKQNLSYLSWAWAVDYIARLDENAEWEYREWENKPFLTLPDNTCMVYCTVTLFGRKRTAHLPIMDHRNKAIQNPDAFQINTAMQRALVKAIALHGLGLYIYAGEDLPEGEEPKEKPAVSPKLDAGPMSGARQAITAEQKKRVDEVVSAVTDWITNGSVDDAVLIKENANLDADETVYFWSFFDSKARSAMKKSHDAMRKKTQDRELATQA